MLQVLNGALYVQKGLEEVRRRHEEENKKKQERRG